MLPEFLFEIHNKWIWFWGLIKNSRSKKKKQFAMRKFFLLMNANLWAAYR